MAITTFDGKANLAGSTVSVAPSPTPASSPNLSVTGGTWPAVPFNALVWPASGDPSPANSEYVRVTANAAGAFTIARTQEGSSARTILVGDRIQAVDTAKTFTDIEQWAGIANVAPTLNRGAAFVLHGLDSGINDFYGAGTVAHDTSAGNFRTGTGSYKIIVPSGGGLAGGHAAIVGQPVDLGNCHFGVWLKSSAWAQVNDVSMLIGSDAVGTWTNYYQVLLKANLTYFTDGEWRFYVFTRSNFSVSGTPNWRAITQVLIRAAGTSTNTPTVWFDSLVACPQNEKGVITIAFDDGHASGYDVARFILDKYDMRASYFVIQELLGTANYMTQANVDALHEDGHEISGHGNTDLSTFTAAQLQADLDAQKVYLGSRGYRGQDVYAYPNGVYNATIFDAVLKRFKAGRTIEGLRQSSTLYNPKSIGAFVVANTTTTAAIIAMIDDAIANGEHLTICFHKIVTTATVATEYSTANFTTVIDYLGSLGQNYVVPFSEALATARPVPYPALRNFITAAVSPGTADVYLANSRIKFPHRPKAGMVYKCRLHVTKSAGVAALAINVRIGTAGAIGDTSRLALAFATSSAAADEALIEIEVHFTSVGSGTSAVVTGTTWLQNRLASTGFTNNTKADNVISSGFDSTPAGQWIGISYNAGSGADHSIKALHATLEGV